MTSIDVSRIKPGDRVVVQTEGVVHEYAPDNYRFVVTDSGAKISLMSVGNVVAPGRTIVSHTPALPPEPTDPENVIVRCDTGCTHEYNPKNMKWRDPDSFDPDVPWATLAHPVEVFRKETTNE